eukprot:4994222-Amphidinium_carterae.1
MTFASWFLVSESRRFASKTETLFTVSALCAVRSFSYFLDASSSTSCSLATASDFSCARVAARLPRRAISRSLGSCVGRTTEGVDERVTTDLVFSCVLLPACDAESVGCTVLTGPLDV